MHHSYEFVTEQEYKPVKENLEELLQKAQKYLENSYPFRYNFVGSTARDMITRDPKQNIGYDFDLNIRFENSSKCSAKNLKLTLMDALNHFVKSYNYDFCEDSKRVITIKVKDQINKKIIHSADLCIVQDLPDGRLKIIKYDKYQNSYRWETLAKYPKILCERADALKNRGMWNQVKNLYLIKKNRNTDPNIKSRSIYSMTIYEMYNKYF